MNNTHRPPFRFGNLILFPKVEVWGIILFAEGGGGGSKTFLSIILLCELYLISQPHLPHPRTLLIFIGFSPYSCVDGNSHNCIYDKTRQKLATLFKHTVCTVVGMAYFVPVLHLVAGTSIRGRVRQEKGILGSMLGDFLAVLFCPFCAIIQEAQELRGDRLMGMARE